MINGQPSSPPAFLPSSKRCALRQELFSCSFVTKNNNNKSLQLISHLPNLLCNSSLVYARVLGLASGWPVEEALYTAKEAEAGESQAGDHPHGQNRQQTGPVLLKKKQNKKLLFTEDVLCAKHCDKHVIYSMSFMPHKSTQ